MISNKRLPNNKLMSGQRIGVLKIALSLELDEANFPENQRRV
jgi:hypothetical protein